MGEGEAHAVLGVAAGADPRQLRLAYLAAVKAVHPDKPGGDSERLRRVVEAYDALRSRPAPVPESPPPPAFQRLEISPAEAMIGGVRWIELAGAGEIQARLPPGLRMGDRVGVSGVAMIVVVVAGEGAAVIGDHLCLTIEVDRAILTGGGVLDVETPSGTRRVRVSRQDGARGLVRVPDAGLPPRGRHGRGDLFIRLEAAAIESALTPAQRLLRRFTAAWAA
jgi:curved DNA-binding protein